MRGRSALSRPVGWLLSAGLLLAGPALCGEFDLQGHRGCAGLMPENTLPAFQRALELEVTTLELDLRLTRDDVLVVHHDPRLSPDRCIGTDGKPVKKLKLRELTAAELEGIDCGASPASGRAGGAGVPAAHIPRLEEVLDLARDAAYPVRVNIEIKQQDSDEKYFRIAELLVEALRDRGMVGRAMVQSFETVALQATAQAEPELRLAALVRKPALYDERLKQTGATVLQPRFDRLRESDVRRLQARGVRVIPWTVNKPADMRRMIDWGVDGFITDYPDRALQILAEE